MTDKEAAREELQKWAHEAVNRNAGPMEESSVFASILSGNVRADPLACLQLGMAIVMDKPLFLIVDKNMTVPKHLVKIAARIERIDVKNKNEVDRAANALGEFMKSLRGNHG
jgi:hypothetical protein